jgi:hypothetical protein
MERSSGNRMAMCTQCGAPTDGLEYVDLAERYRLALEEIAERPTFERNPDGEDQAAHTMQLIAKEALES